MNQKRNKLMFNQSFQTGGRTVFKVGGGFEILPGESGADLNIGHFEATRGYVIYCVNNVNNLCE